MNELLLAFLLWWSAPQDPPGDPPPPLPREAVAVPEVPRASDEGEGAMSFYRKLLAAPDDLHLFLSRQLVNRADELDTFFGDDRLEDDPKYAMVRVRLRERWTERGELSSRVRVRVRLPFYRTKRRLQLVVDSLGGNEDQEEIEERFETQQDEESFAGLRSVVRERRRYSVSLDAGVRVRSGVEPRAEVKFQRRFGGETWRGRILEGIFYRDDDGFGERTRLDLERPVGSLSLFRSRTEGEWSEESRGVELEQSLSFTQPIDDKRAISASLGMGLHTRPSWIVDGYDAELRLRRQLHRRWLFLEVAPGAAFPRERRYEFTPRLEVLLEIRFGGEAIPRKPPPAAPTIPDDDPLR